MDLVIVGICVAIVIVSYIYEYWGRNYMDKRIRRLVDVADELQHNLEETKNGKN